MWLLVENTVHETGQIGMCHGMDAQTSHPQNLHCEKIAFKVFSIAIGHRAYQVPGNGHMMSFCWGNTFSMTMAGMWHCIGKHF